MLFAFHAHTRTNKITKEKPCVFRSRALKNALTFFKRSRAVDLVTYAMCAFYLIAYRLSMKAKTKTKQQPPYLFYK